MTDPNQYAVSESSLAHAVSLAFFLDGDFGQNHLYDIITAAKARSGIGNEYDTMIDLFIHTLVRLHKANRVEFIKVVAALFDAGKVVLK